MLSSHAMFSRRRQRTRMTLKRKAKGRIRLSVHRSSRHIYAQVIDDQAARTVVAASTVDKELKGSLSTTADVAAAAAVGKLLAERAVAQGVTEVVFDRGGFRYHGRIKALADAAREAGLNF